MCLAQFASYYDYTKSKPTKSRIEDGYSQDEISEDKCIFGTDIELPKYIQLKTITGFMRLRGHPAVIKTHSPSKKQDTEKYYSLMFMFSAWDNEPKDLPRDPKELLEKFVIEQDWGAFVPPEIRNAWGPSWELVQGDPFWEKEVQASEHQWLSASASWGSW